MALKFLTFYWSGSEISETFINVIASCIVGSENLESFLILLYYKGSTPLTVSIMSSLCCISTGGICSYDSKPSAASL